MARYAGRGADGRPRGARGARPGGLTIPFELDEFERHCLLEGLDEIGLTLRHEAEITAYEAARSAPFDTTALSAG